MKQKIRLSFVLILVILLSLYLVACDQNCHHEYDSSCDDVCNNCGEKRQIDHKDNAYDGICDICGSHAPIPLISSEEEWRNAFMVVSNNFSVLFTVPVNILDISQKGESEGIASFDGVTKMHKVSIVNINENGTKTCLNEKTELCTKIGDRYIKFCETVNDGKVEGREMVDVNEDEYIDFFKKTNISLFWMPLSEHFDDFTFNTQTGQYEGNNVKLAVGKYIYLEDDSQKSLLYDSITITIPKVIAEFEDGKIVKLIYQDVDSNRTDTTFASFPREIIFTYGETSTIQFPETAE